MPHLLPATGDVSLQELADAIRYSSETLGVPDVLEARSLLVNVNGKLANIATLLRVGFEESLAHPEHENHRVGPLVLIAHRICASDVASPGHVLTLLNRWATVTETATQVDPQFPTSVDRFPSFSIWGPVPCWAIALHDRVSSGNYYNAPRGPFYDPKTRFFAESMAAAAWLWVGDSQARDLASVANSYRVVICDRRLEIARKELNRDKSGSADLRLWLRTGLKKLPAADVAVVTVDFDGQRSRTVSEIDGDNVVVPLNLPLQTLEAVILDRATGSWLDRVQEGSYGQDSLLSPVREAADPKYQRLRDDLERGECDTVEFKEFIELFERDKKSYELLKEVTAFANAVGGVIYIGVNNDTDVVGVAKQLARANKKVAQPDLNNLRARYADLARRVINEGVSPTPRIELEWIEHAGLHVLRIEVRVTAAAPHHVVEDGQHYYRRGGSCKKGLPERFIVRGGHGADRDRSDDVNPFVG